MFFTNIAELLGAGTSRLNILLSKAASGDELTVVVIPTVEGDEKVKGAIARPLSLTGTPAELDAEFAQLMGQYASQRKSLSDQINAELTILAADAKASAKRATEKLQTKKDKAKAGVSATTVEDQSDDGSDADDDEAGDGSGSTAAPSPSETDAPAPAPAPAAEPAGSASTNPLAGLDLFS
jgi:PRTRC genetic system protein E